MLNIIKSYAKINLFLYVVNKLDAGFHELNSVLSRIDLYDEIRIKDESSFSISYSGPFGAVSYTHLTLPTKRIV